MESWLPALQILSAFVSGGQVSFPTSKVQVATAHAILSSVTATLVCLKQVIYLHKDDEFRSLALVIRNGIISSLSSSTPLGQVVAFLDTVPVSLALIETLSTRKKLYQAMDLAAVRNQDNRQDSKYGS